MPPTRAHSRGLISAQVFDTQTEYFNVPVSTMTPSACRDKLTEVALSVLEKHGKLGSGPRSKAFGEFRDRLEVKQKGDYINGGNESLDDMKYLSESVRLVKGVRWGREA